MSNSEVSLSGNNLAGAANAALAVPKRVSTSYFKYEIIEMTETDGQGCPVITRVQIKAARALLGWSQADLAEKAAVATSTLADFERGHRSPVPNNLDAIRSALEAAGISFPPGGAVLQGRHTRSEVIQTSRPTNCARSAG